MTEGQFDQHFMEIFAKGDSMPMSKTERAALLLAALVLTTVGGALLLAQALTN